eukprot:5224893-Lingulodinium_polyedra.AAC.1
MAGLPGPRGPPAAAQFAIFGMPSGRARRCTIARRRARAQAGRARARVWESRFSSEARSILVATHC